MDIINFNKEILIDELQKYYTNTNLNSLKYFYNNKYYKFNKLTNYSLNINKYVNGIVITNDFILSKTNTILTVCKVIRNKKTLNYGFIYGTIKDNSVNNLFTLLSLSSVSKDGEYKHNLLNFKYIDFLFKKSIIITIFEYLNNNYKNDEIHLNIDIYNLNKKNIKKTYKQKLKNNILLLKLYTIVWIFELYNKHINGDILNIDENHFNILISPKDLLFFQEIYKNNKLEIDNIIPLITNYNNSNKLEFGQKLLPFNYNQLKDYKHLIHFQWKELLANRIINNLIYNNISACFSLFVDWILITKSDKNLYNNNEIFKKINYSDQIKHILQLLYLAKSNLLKLNNVQDKNKLISKLEKKLHNLIELTQSNMLMSNVSLSFISEYSGVTLFNYLNLSLQNKQIINNIGNLMDDYDIFAKYIFEIIYSLYSLNLKGIIHGDLHLNNITLNLNNPFNDNKSVLYDLNNIFNNDIIKYIKNYPYLYETNDEISSPFKKNSNDLNNLNNSDEQHLNKLSECFLFKHNGYFPCIIDYGRSFLLLKLIDEDIIEIEKTSVRQKYIKNETKRVINELNKIFPNYIKNNMHKLKFLFKNKNFNILFIYFTAYDTFTFITNLLIFMKKTSLNYNININPRIINLLSSISKKSYYYLEQILNEDNYTSNKTHQFPNYLLLKEMFPEYIATQKTLDTEINHYFNLININKYYSLKDISNINKNIILNYINSSKLSNNEKNKLKNRFSNIINSDIIYNNEMEVEKIINKEYYNIKSNVHIISSVVNDNHLDYTYDITTNSLNISNY
jgi:hypothetical protein